GRATATGRQSHRPRVRFAGQENEVHALETRGPEAVYAAHIETRPGRLARALAGAMAPSVPCHLRGARMPCDLTLQAAHTTLRTTSRGNAATSGARQRARGRYKPQICARWH